MSQAWNNYKQTLSGFTPEEEALLRQKYQEYCDRHQRWHWKDGHVESFDTWWRSQADEAKDRAKYQD